MTERPVEYFIPALSHWDDKVRRYAAILLGIEDNQLVTPFLVDAMGMPEAPVRRASAGSWVNFEIMRLSRA